MKDRASCVVKGERRSLCGTGVSPCRTGVSPVRGGKGFPMSGERARCPFHMGSMFQKVAALALSVAVALGCAFTASADIPASAYVQEGLVAQFDGIENAGAGLHNANATTWKDLKGTHDVPLISGDSFGDDCIKIVRGTRETAAALFDAYTQITIEFNARPTAMDAAGNWNAPIANIPYVGSFGWDGRAGAITVMRPQSATATAYNYRTYNSGYTKLADLIAAGVFQTYTAMPGYGKQGGADDPVYVNAKKVAKTNGMDWDGGTRAQSLLMTVGASKTASDIRSLRIYNRALAAAEVAYNALVDKIRFGSVDSEKLGYRWNSTMRKLEIRVSVKVEGAGGTVSIAGGGDETWVEFGSTVEFTVVPTEGASVVNWRGGTPTKTGENAYAIVADGSIALTAMIGTGLCMWTGAAGDGLWTTAGNWSTEATPQEGEVVRLGTGTVTLTNSTPELAAVEIASTLAMSNWTACVRATTVTVANGGKVTVAGLSTDQATNRVWIVCDDCTIAAGGSIDVNDLGFRSSKDTRADVGGKASYVSGPGKGTSEQTGASHGGHGGYIASKGLNKTKFQNVLPYDDPLKPLLPGSGGYPQTWGSGTAGGGAVYISAAKSVRVDGAIKASVTKTVSYRGTSGSGGAVLIECETFCGTGGTISADGGGSSSTIATIVGDGYGGAAGGGGMIAIKYDPAKQTEDMIANMTISASSGLYDSKKAFGDETVRFDAGLGTVYFPDNKLLKDTFGRGLSGALINCASYVHEGDLTFGKGYLRLASEGAKLKVNGNLTLTGKMTRLDIGGVTITNQCTVAGIWAGRQTNVLEVAGSLAITDGGRLDLRAAETNELVSIGAYLKVGGQLSVATNSTLSCWSDQVNMGSPFIEADSFRLDEGGLVTGSMRGCGPGKGLGGGKSASGGSHGGKSGEGTYSSAAQKPYDDEYLPTMPGSGGGNGSWAAGGPGGGVVHISVAREATVNGTINVDGMPAAGSHTGGGGAGGAIQIRCRTFFGGETGVLTAKGCDGLSASSVGGGSGGGGGRIAIWCGAPWGPDVSRFRIKPFTDVKSYPEFFSFAMTTNVTGGVGAGGSAAVPTDPKTIADPGTVRFVYVRDKMGMRVLVR